VLIWAGYFSPESHVVLASKTARKGLAAQQILGVYTVIALDRYQKCGQPRNITSIARSGGHPRSVLDHVYSGNKSSCNALSPVWYARNRLGFGLKVRTYDTLFVHN